MPRADQLPESLAALVRRNALELSPSRFEADTARLLRVVERTIAEMQAGRQQPATERAPLEPQREPQPELEPEPEPELPEPEPQAEAQPQPEPEPTVLSGPEPFATRTPDSLEATEVPPAASSRWEVSRWVILTLLAAGVVLVVANWPGHSGWEYAWKDEDNGFYVKRTWHDPYILASILVVAGAAAALVRRMALGVAVGAGAFLGVDSAVYLGAGLTYEGTGRWLTTLALAAAVFVAGWLVWRPEMSPRRIIPAAAATLVGVGAVFVAIGISVTSASMSWLEVTHGLALLAPLGLLVLAWPALAGGGDASRWPVGMAGITAAVLGIVDSVPALQAMDTASFTIGLVGEVTYAAGVAFAAAAYRPGRGEVALLRQLPGPPGS
jgi:hypothetical protein